MGTYKISIVFVLGLAIFGKGQSFSKYGSKDDNGCMKKNVSRQS